MTTSYSLPSLSLLAGLLVGLPATSLAQASPTPPRYYVGLAAYSSDYQPLGRSFNSGVRLPVQAMVGYQLRPRLALQLGVAASSQRFSYEGMTTYYTGPAGTGSQRTYIYSDAGHTRNTSLALLGRYTLTRRAAHRFQVDALGGLTLELRRSALESTSAAYDSTNTQTFFLHEEYSFRDSGLLLTAGLSPRFRFSQHLEAVLDVTLNKNLLVRSGNLTGATALGLRYRFGSGR